MDVGGVLAAKPTDFVIGDFTSQTWVEVDGWDITFVAPRGGDGLKVGEFPDAKRYPFHDTFPGLNFSGNGRGSNKLTGKFVVWELEKEGDTVKKLAIDFVQNSEGRTATPLCGMLRYNSSLE